MEFLQQWCNVFTPQPQPVGEKRAIIPLKPLLTLPGPITNTKTLAQEDPQLVVPSPGVVGIHNDCPSPLSLSPLPTQCSLHVGGWLGVFAMEWHRRVTRPWVVSILQEGYSQEFLQLPALWVEPIVNYSADPGKQAALPGYSGQGPPGGGLQSLNASVLQPGVPGAQEVRGIVTSHRSQGVEHVSCAQAVQDGVGRVHLCGSSPGAVDVLHRSSKC